MPADCYAVFVLNQPFVGRGILNRAVSCNDSSRAEALKYQAWVSALCCHVDVAKVSTATISYIAKYWGATDK